MSSVPVASSPTAVFSHSSESKSSSVESGGQQAFDQVLSRRIERDDSPRPAQQQPESTTKNTATEEQGTNEAQSQQGLEAISPWLQMLAQTTPAQVEAPEKSLTADAALQEADHSGTQLLTAGMVLPAPVLPVSSSSNGLSTGISGEARVGNVDVANLPIAANTGVPTGKDLPQVSTDVADVGGFADELLGKLSTTDDMPAQLPLQSTAAAVLTPKSENVAQSTAVRHAVAEPVGDSHWGDAVAQRVSLMLGRQEQQLEMQLNPPHLGPMEVRLTMGGEQASVVFTSQSAAVREALAAATPRLSALLADQGIHLANVQVASDSLNQQAQEQARQQTASGHHGESRQRTINPFEFEGAVEQRVLSGVSIPVARSGVSLYV